MAQYEVHAIKYGSHVLKSAQAFIIEDPHDSPWPIYYYVWLIQGEGRNIMVDTGFTAERAAKRGRAIDRCPSEGLKAFGLGPEDIDTVILTHLHYDHAGNIPLFPNAEIIVQDKEVNFATGRYMRYPIARLPFEPDDVCDLVRQNYNGKVRFVDGDKEIMPGLKVHLMGGHSRGLMCATVATRRGQVVVASDCAHFYDNIALEVPFPIVADVPAQCESQERLVELAESPAHVVPGHDPKVMDLYPKHPNDENIVDLTADLLGPSPLG